MLGLKTRQCKQLKGFSFGFQKPVKIVQYADDCVFFLNCKKELGNVIDLLEDFGTVSGLVLNCSKSEGLWLGKHKTNQLNCNLHGIKWPDQIRCLGIYVGHNTAKNIEKNWSEKLEKVKKLLKGWNNRFLSLFGKVQIIKSFAISQFVLPVTVLNIPTDIEKQIETILFNFIWGSKDKVSRSKVIKGCNNGGLNMIDVKTLFMSFKAIWINKLLSCSPNVHSWSQLPYMYYKPFLDCDKTLCFNIDRKVGFCKIEQLSTFYKEVLYCFAKAGLYDIDYFQSNIYHHCIWANKFITVKRRNKKCVLFLRNWIRSGIININDLRFIDGILDEYYVYQKIMYGNNIWAEVFTVKNALLPFRDYLRVTTNVQRRKIECVNFNKTKQFYAVYNSEEANIVTNFLALYYNEDDASYVYKKKIVHQREVKLKEFNFKMLHGILPCNLNLYRWRIRDSDQCDVCGETQNIEHLLYNCMYVKPIWKEFQSLFNVKISFATILGIDRNCEYDLIVTLVAYLIYKEWLLQSLENLQRKRNITYHFYIEELDLRWKIYKRCRNFKDIDLAPLKTFIQHIGIL